MEVGVVAREVDMAGALTRPPEKKWKELGFEYSYWYQA